ncbi:hypothetical protein PsgRace4_19516, partial [Pseudomonas savastanoi pv. glycinea str. race 4]
VYTLLAILSRQLLQADCLRMEIQNYAVLFGNGTCRLLCRKLCEFIN